MPRACVLILASLHRHESAKYDLDTLAPLPEPPAAAIVLTPGRHQASHCDAHGLHPYLGLAAQA
jgi:hypothetical protein